MRKDAYYFSHDSNARNDPKIVSMMTVYGWYGYGLYWAVVELMREQGDYKIKMDKYVFKSLSLQLRVDEQKITKFIQDCIGEFELFKVDKNMIFSNSLLRRMKLKEIKSKKARQSASKRWNKNNEVDANAMQTHSESNTTQHSERNASKGKESKKKVNNKVNENVKYNPTRDRQEFIDNIPMSLYKSYDDFTHDEIYSTVDKLLDYCLSSGKTYKDYYAALRNFLRGERDKTKRNVSKSKNQLPPDLR